MKLPKENMNTYLTPVTTPEMVDQAAHWAHEAHLISAQQTPEIRASWLVSIAQGLRDNSDELIALAMTDTNLSRKRLEGELTRSAFQLELLAEEIRSGVALDAVIDHADPHWGMGPRPDIRRVNVPLGVIGVFGASNFPFAFSVIGGDSASALAAGCAVLHKIHPGHLALARRTAEIVIDVLHGAGAPDGLFGVVEGREAAVALVQHPLVKAIGFTGSTAGGRALFDLACARPEPIPFFGELGSINPVFVLPGAWGRRQEEILAGYANSFTMGMGQFCTKPGLLFVPAGEKENGGYEKLVALLREVQLDKLLTPGLHESYLTTRDEVSKLAGIKVLVPGSDDEKPEPTVFTIDIHDVRYNPEVLHREMFGPATILVEYEDTAQLVELAGQLQGQLTVTLHADDDDDLTTLMEAITAKTGRVVFNEWPTGVTVSYAQHHGGPYPATTAPSATSVGTASIGRFMRPVAYQGLPDSALPPSIQESNPWGIARRVDGQFHPAAGDGATDEF